MYDNFYDEVTPALRKTIASKREMVNQMSILKPYSFVLEDEERENIAELYVVDDDTVIIDKELMEGLDKDLNDFLNQLLA